MCRQALLYLCRYICVYPVPRGVKREKPRSSEARTPARRTRLHQLQRGDKPLPDAPTGLRVGRARHQQGSGEVHQVVDVRFRTEYNRLAVYEVIHPVGVNEVVAGAAVDGV